MSQRKAAWTPATPQVQRKACCDATPPLSLSPPSLRNPLCLSGGFVDSGQKNCTTGRDGGTVDVHVVPRNAGSPT